ncbi:hypothetical protein [Streptomyces phaeoluteigriseus]|uniref:hypothetical protein n=1 Tax=Streptomyces phaeoluteigriseus TaxID=114686 RepID=UPI00130201E3|nr:hypothetical protein [Streptomyces phaeoluteigriseus]
MAKKNRTPSTHHQDHVAPTPVSWRHHISVALLIGAVRHIGTLLAGLAVAWWRHD